MHLSLQIRPSNAWAENNANIFSQKSSQIPWGIKEYSFNPFYSGNQS